VKIVGVIALEPCVHSVTEVGHARQDGAIGCASEAHFAERSKFGQTYRRWRGNKLNQPFCGRHKPFSQLLIWCERNDDAEERPLIGAENKSAWAIRGDFGFPVAEASTARTIRIWTAQAL
jgi:hypothetical protein